MDEFKSNDIPKYSFNGTIFRLPLRNKQQANDSLLSNCYYDENELIELMTQFAKEAGEMILFLNHLEDIKILIKQKDGKIINLAHIFISNMNENLKNSRSKRNLIYSDNKHSKVSSFEIKLSEKLLHEEINEKIWILSSIVKERILNQQEMEIDSSATIQWVNVACCINKILQSGKVYCSLPLPMQTGFPVHINGNFALSSNRRHLWEQSETEQFGPAAFKSLWNKELAILACSAYFILLDKLKLSFSSTPNELYNYWPISSESNYFQQHLVPEFIKELVQNKSRKYFWDNNKNRWLSLSNVIFPDHHLSMDDPFYKILNSIHITTVFPPMSHISLLKSSGLKIPILSPMNLIFIIKELHNKTIQSSEIADQLLNYILKGIQDKSLKETKKIIQNLDGLQILPLYNNKIGTIQNYSANQIQKESIYLLCDNIEFMNVLSGFNQFIDPNSISYKKLKLKNIIQSSNIREFLPSILPTFMSFVVPKTWYNVSCVYVSGRLLHENVLNISVSNMKNKKKKSKQIPSGLLYARDNTVSVSGLTEQLNLLWKFIQTYLPDDKFISGLQSWPLIIIDSPEGEMVCTIESWLVYSFFYLNAKIKQIVFSNFYKFFLYKNV